MSVVRRGWRVAASFAAFLAVGCNGLVEDSHGGNHREPLPAADGGSHDEPDIDASDMPSHHDAGMIDELDATMNVSADAGDHLDSAIPEDAAVITHCAPTADGPYYVVEGDTLQVTLECSTGLPIAEAALQFDSPPLGAAYDDATATLTWTPTLDQAAVYELPIRAATWDETGSVKIGVADRWNDLANVPIVDPTTYTEELGLPVIHLTTDPTINGDAYTPATIIYRGHSYVGAQAKTRGAFSSTYPKKSYTLKFTKEDKFADAQMAGGFFAKRKVTLITTFDDNSYLRQRLAYELWNRMDPAHIQIQTYSAVLFLDGEYYGLYTVADHVDGYLMEDHGLNQDGNLYKARTHDANFKTKDAANDTKTNMHLGYTKEEGTPLDGEPGAYDDLDAFVTWVASSTSANFLSEIDTRIERSEYEAWWIYVSFIMADDSAGKNSYHYRDPTLAGSLWRFIPWDMNHSFGQDWRTLRTGASSTQPEGYYVNMNRLFERMLAEPTLGTPLRARYTTELTTTFEDDGVVQLFDSMVPEIDASARRDAQKWDIEYRTFGAWSSRSDFLSYEDELQYVRQWIHDRHTYLDTLY